jgi:hypothetical protein
MDWSIPAIVGSVVYFYIVVFNTTMKTYKESDYSMTWSEFVTRTFPVERLVKSFTG